MVVSDNLHIQIVISFPEQLPELGRMLAEAKKRGMLAASAIARPAHEWHRALLQEAANMVVQKIFYNPN